MPVSPPRPRNPSLNALRAFEAAARLGGFKAAAEELSITPGAISQHIKQLEAWTGTFLFERKSQGVVLTEAGQTVAPLFTEAFNTLGGAVRHLRNQARDSTLHIAALPSVAQLWLSHRLPAAHHALPELRVSITALETPPDLHRDMFDLSIFLGNANPQEEKRIIGRDTIFPVCTPGVASRLSIPEDMLNEVRLSDATWSNDWTIWANQVNPELAFPQDGPSFSLYSMAVEEARRGAGILMGHELLLKPLLDSGELVAPFNQKIETGQFLYIGLPSNVRTGSPTGRLLKLLII